VFNIGLVGTGFMGRTHSAAFEQIPGARISAICSRNPDSARPLADQWGAAVYASLEEMLDKEPLDAIDICLPTHLHREAAELAAAAGKHVFCEKPIAASTEDAMAMITACRQAGVVLMIGHVTRFNPEYAAAKQQLLDGALGKPGVLRTSRVSEFPSWAAWYSNYGNEGTLIDLAIHDFDFLRWCLGPVKRVFTHQVSAEKFDHSLTILRFASGAMAHVEASWAYPAGTAIQVSLEIAGSNGLALFDRQKAYPIQAWHQDGGGRAALASPLARNHYVRELEHFLDCIQHRKKPLTSGEEALEALRISLAAVRSARSGQPVELEAVSL